MDRRVRKTNTGLKQALLQLLQKDDINVITVDQIAALADVNRSTFYAHFADKYELLAQLTDDWVSSLMQACLTHTGAFYQDSLNEAMHFIADNQTTYRLLMRHKRDTRFDAQLRQALSVGIEKTLRLRSPEPDTLKVAYLAGGIEAVIEDWLNVAHQLSSNEVTQRLRQYLAANLTGILG